MSIYRPYATPIHSSCVSPNNNADDPSQQRLNQTKTPFEILGIYANASDEEIITAYRTMVKLYHPDKVASMAPEIQLLAETRMKEINSAYEILRKKNNVL